MKLGPYDLEAEIGRGGMGRVYRARHRTTGAVRAVKALIDADSDPEALARFEREAAALVRAGGDGVVRLHESGQEGRTLWFAMDLMPGGSLRGLMKESGRLPWRDAASIVADLARALGRCHESGLVHRDVKPENVLFDPEGRPRLADFGVSRDLSASRLTMTGAVLGTPGYMAPEQLDGRPADARADVFALGVILYELVAGERPFRGERHWDLLRAIHAGQFARPSTVASCPPELDALVERVLAEDAGRRPADGEALALEIERVLAGARSRPILPFVIVGLAAVAVLAGALAARHGAPPPRPSPSVAPVVTAARPSAEELARREALRHAVADLVNLIRKRFESQEEFAKDAINLILEGKKDDRAQLAVADQRLLAALDKAGAGEKDMAVWNAVLEPVAVEARRVLRARQSPGFGDHQTKEVRRAVLVETLGRLASRNFRLGVLRKALEITDLPSGVPRAPFGDECASLVLLVENDDPALAFHFLAFSYSWATKRPASPREGLERARGLLERCRNGDDDAWATRNWADLETFALSEIATDPDERLRLREDGFVVGVDAWKGKHGADDDAHGRMLMVVNAFLIAPNAKDLSPEVLNRLDKAPLDEALRRLVAACRETRSGDLETARQDVEKARAASSAFKGNRRDEILDLARAISKEIEARSPR